MSEFITHKEIATVVREETGIPVGKSTVAKKCSPAIGGGPPVAAWIGRCPLYKRDDVIAWAKSLLRPAEQAERVA
jgi:hypothetical protein